MRMNPGAAMGMGGKFNWIKSLLPGFHLICYNYYLDSLNFTIGLAVSRLSRHFNILVRS